MTKRRIANRCLRERHPQQESRIQTLLLPFYGWKNTFATLVCLMWMKGLLRPVLLAWFPLVLSAQRASSFLRRWCTDLNRPRILYRTRVFGVSPSGVPVSLIPGWGGQEAVAAGHSALLCLPELSIHTHKGLHPKNHLPFPALGCSP